MQANYVDSITFTVLGDETSEFVKGRRIKADCGTDGEKISEVTSSSYDSGSNKTTVNIDDGVLTSNLSEVFYAVVSPGSKGSLPLHTHDDDGQGGSGVQDIIMPLARLERIARGDYQSHAAMKGYTDVFFERLLDESKISSIGSNVVVTTGRNGNVELVAYETVAAVWSVEPYTQAQQAIDYHDSGYLFVGGGLDYLIKMDLDGNVMWTMGLSNYISVITVVGDYVYLGTHYNLAKFDLDGNKQWEKSNGDNPSFNIESKSNGNIVYAYGEYVEEIDPSDGSTIGSFTADAWSRQLAIDTNDNIYITDENNNKVYKLYSDLSGTIWTISDADVGWYTVGMVFLDNGNLLHAANADGGVVKERKPEDGSLIQSSNVLGGTIYELVLLSTGDVVMCTKSNEVIKIASSDLSKLWTYTGHSDTVHDVTFDLEDYIYTASEDREVKKISSGVARYNSSGSLTSVDINLGYTPSAFRVEQDVDIPADEDIQYDIKDGSGNIVTVSQSEIGTQIDASSFASGETTFTASPNLSTSDGHDTPILNEYAVYFK